MADQGAGLYFDGVTGAAQPVELKLEASAIAIASPAGVPLARWDYAAIQQLISLKDRLRLALADSDSTARIEVRDAAFAEMVRQRLGFTPRHHASERRRRRLVVVWTAAAVAAVMAVAVAGLPALADFLTPLVSHQMEARIGATIQQAALSRYRVKKGPLLCGDVGETERAGKAAFDKMFDQMEKAANLPIPLRTFIIRTPVFNAGAIPGGYLHFNQGLILLAETPAELASVIGHEIGHLVHRHSLRRHLHNLGLTFLAAMAVGDVFAAIGVTIAARGDLDRRNTRAQERQADAYGAQLMARLGADSHAAADLWDRVARIVAKQKKSGIPPRALLSYTHPVPLERAAAIRALPKVVDPKPLLTDEEWKTLRGVCSGK